MIFDEKEVPGCSVAASTASPNPTTTSKGSGVVASVGAQKFIQGKFKHGRLWRGFIQRGIYFLRGKDFKYFQFALKVN